MNILGHAGRFTVGWTALFGFWLLLVGTNSRLELLCGAVAALLGGVAALTVRTSGLLSVKVEPRLLAQTLKVPLRVVVELWWIVAALARRPPERTEEPDSEGGTSPAMMFLPTLALLVCGLGLAFAPELGRTRSPRPSGCRISVRTRSRCCTGCGPGAPAPERRDRRRRRPLRDRDDARRGHGRLPRPLPAAAAAARGGSAAPARAEGRAQRRHRRLRRVAHRWRRDARRPVRAHASVVASAARSPAASRNVRRKWSVRCISAIATTASTTFTVVTAMCIPMLKLSSWVAPAFPCSM